VPKSLTVRMNNAVPKSPFEGGRGMFSIIQNHNNQTNHSSDEIEKAAVGSLSYYCICVNPFNPRHLRAKPAC
jgi:hypothetical protein